MIASIALTLLAIALLPAWSPNLRIGTSIARILSSTREILLDMNEAARRVRQLQLGTDEGLSEKDSAPDRASTSRLA